MLTESVKTRLQATALVLQIAIHTRSIRPAIFQSEYEKHIKAILWLKSFGH